MSLNVVRNRIREPELKRIWRKVMVEVHAVVGVSDLREGEQTWRGYVDV